MSARFIEANCSGHTKAEPCDPLEETSVTRDPPQPGWRQKRRIHPCTVKRYRKASYKNLIHDNFSEVGPRARANRRFADVDQRDAGVNAPPICLAIVGMQYGAVAAGGNQLFGFRQGNTLQVYALPRPWHETGCLRVIYSDGHRV